MKTFPILIGVIAGGAVLLSAYLTNVGQEMAVRVGGLSGEDLNRLPTSALLAEARAATPTTDPKAVMSAVHTILNAQLLLFTLTALSSAAVLLAVWNKARNAGSRPPSRD